ncbi:hypothetical protein [Caldovatus aquaticus]|uniref:Uncharacterized protein n=1 Tax=Caldovatus aquaticus TaxID=2865671 RepID=A0ABS7F633_9PROT|nr:hypothetical protein [Caldovatus aquaticus]MBW8270968.1 hypothetical protein [Caldovatus aquaticus]
MRAARGGGPGALRRAALFAGALPLFWIVPEACLTLLSGLAAGGAHSLLAAELAGQLRVPRGAAIALAIWAAAIGAALHAFTGQGLRLGSF